MMVVVAEKRFFAREPGRRQTTGAVANDPGMAAGFALMSDMVTEGRKGAPPKLALVVMGLGVRINGEHSLAPGPPWSGGRNLESNAPRLKLFEEGISHLFHTAEIGALHQHSHREGGSLAGGRLDEGGNLHLGLFRYTDGYCLPAGRELGMPFTVFRPAKFGDVRPGGGRSMSLAHSGTRSTRQPRAG